MSSEENTTAAPSQPLLCCKPGCGKEAEIKCSRCMDAPYCSEQCLKEHFDEHVKSCTQADSGEIILNKSQMDKLAKIEGLKQNLQKNFQMGDNESVISASLEILELLVDFPPPIRLGEGIQIRMNLSTAFLRSKKLEQALEHANLAVNEAKVATELRKGHPQAIEVMAIALTINVAASIANNQLDAALEMAKLAQMMGESIYPKNDPRIIKFLRPLANVYEQKGEITEAENTLIKAYTIASIAKGPHSLEALIITDELVSIFMTRKDSTNALKHAIKNYTNIKEKTNLTEEEKLILAEASSRISNIYAVEGKFAEAEPYVKHTLEIREASKVSPPQPLKLAYALSQFVAIEESLKKLSEESVKKLEKALDIFSKISGPYSPDFAKCTLQLKKVKNLLNPNATTEADTKAKQPNGKFGYVDMSYQITLLREKSRVTDAELKLIQSFKPDDAPGRMVAANNFFETGKMVIAQALISDAYQIFLAKNGPDHPATKASLNNLLATKKHRLDQIWIEAATEEILEMEEKDKNKPENPVESTSPEDLGDDELAFINSLSNTPPPSTGGCILC